MYELPPTLGRSRTDLVVLAMLVALVVAGALGLAFVRPSEGDAAPPKAPALPTSTLHVS